MMEIVQLIIAKADAENKILENETVVEDLLLHGMDRDQLNAMLLSIFKAADKDGSGALDRAEFQNALRSADLGLTRKEINGLLHVVDENEDGQISYEEFAPLAFDICVQIYARQLAHESLPSGDAEIAQYFTDLFASADAEQTGRLPYSTLCELMKASDLGMSRVQIHTVLGVAIKDDDETVNYSEFAISAATMVGSMLNFEDSAARLAVRQDESYAIVAGMDEAAFTDTLNDILASADSSGTGCLPLESIQDAIFSVHPECTGEEMSALLTLLLLDENAAEEMYTYDDLIRYGWQVLLSQKEMRELGTF